MRRKKAKELGERLAGEILLSKGWYLHDDGWKHPRLFFPWPVWGALRLVRDVERGADEEIHRMLRG